MNIRSGLLFLIFLASIALAFWVYPNIQYPAVSHWDINGTPNGFILPFWAAAFGPLLIGFILFLWWGIPKIDPLRENIKEFRAVYDWLWVIVSLTLFYIYGLTLYYNTGNLFNFNTALVPGLALTFIAIGALLPYTKRNWFMGIRTPWTLANETIWQKTHRVGGVLFIVAGTLMLGGLLAPTYALFFFVVPLLGAAFGSVVYSYILFRASKGSS